MTLISIPLPVIFTAAATTSALMNISTSGGLGGLRPPTSPDFWVCDRLYAGPKSITSEDCAMAVRSMPSGFERVVWHNRAEGSEDYKLPLIRTHGSCRITVFASGKWADENDLQVSVSPDLFRQLALYVIQECVVTDQESGYITHGFKRAVDWVTDPTTHFPTNLAMPANTTYFTAVVQDSEDDFPVYDHDPGNYGLVTLSVMMHELKTAMQHAPANSYRRRDLGMRWEYLLSSGFIEWSGMNHLHAWWEPRPNLVLPNSKNSSTKSCDLSREPSGRVNCSKSYAGSPGSVAK